MSYTQPKDGNRSNERKSLMKDSQDQNSDFTILQSFLSSVSEGEKHTDTSCNPTLAESMNRKAMNAVSLSKDFPLAKASSDDLKFSMSDDTRAL